HFRAYASCACIVGAAVLWLVLISRLTSWLVLRVFVGLGMMCKYMVIESLLNENAAAKQRCMDFSGYIIESYLWLVLGQLVLVL
ncbi:MFS transporter, partial [Pseudomonas syringae pv. tagetis]